MAALALRLGLLAWEGPSKRHFGDDDERMYAQYAQSLAERGVLEMAPRYPDAPPLQAFRPPLLPLLWAPLWMGGSLVPIRLLLALLGACLAPATAWVAGLMFSRREALWAGALAAGYPMLSWLSVRLLGETPCLLSLTLSLGCALKGKPRWALASGALLAVAALGRSVLTGFLPLSLLWMAGRSRRQAGLYALGFLLVMSPWWVRNALVFHRFVATTTDGGECFYIGNHPKALGDPRGYWMPPRFDEVRGMGECEAQARFYALGWENVVAHPATALRLAWTKFGRFWRPWPHARYVGTRAAWIDGLSFVPLILLAALGLDLSIRQGGLARSGAVWLLLLAAWMTAAHMAFVATTRYRAPLYPGMAVFAAAALASRRRRS